MFAYFILLLFFSYFVIKTIKLFYENRTRTRYIISTYVEVDKLEKTINNTSKGAKVFSIIIFFMSYILHSIILFNVWKMDKSIIFTVLFIIQILEIASRVKYVYEILFLEDGIEMNLSKIRRKIKYYSYVVLQLLTVAFYIYAISIILLQLIK